MLAGAAMVHPNCKCDIAPVNPIQSCRFGPESKPNPETQYLDPAWYHLWL